MREKWMKILPKLTDNFVNPQEIQCPNCGDPGDGAYHGRCVRGGVHYRRGPDGFGQCRYFRGNLCRGRGRTVITDQIVREEPRGNSLGLFFFQKGVGNERTENI